MNAFSRNLAIAALVTVASSSMMFGSTNGVRAEVANPCGPKEGAGPGKPELDAKLVTRPKGTALFQADRAQLIKEGEALFKSTKLSTNGLSCQSCHANNENLAATFAKPYPHRVAMVEQKAGVGTIGLDEMVQFCMIAPMQAKPFAWNSRQLAALTAYNAELQKSFRAELKGSEAKNKDKQQGGSKKAANPCAAK